MFVVCCDRILLDLCALVYNVDITDLRVEAAGVCRYRCWKDCKDRIGLTTKLWLRATYCAREEPNCLSAQEG